MANTAANAISGDKSVGEAAADELQNARRDIGNAIRSANANRKTPNKRKKKKIGGKLASKRKRVRRSVFDDDDDY